MARQRILKYISQDIFAKVLRTEDPGIGVDYLGKVESGRIIPNEHFIDINVRLLGFDKEVLMKNYLIPLIPLHGTECVQDAAMMSETYIGKAGQIHRFGTIE